MIRGLAAMVPICLLSACGPDGYQANGSLPTTNLESQEGAVLSAPPPFYSACFSNAAGLQMNEDGTVVDDAGAKLSPLPLTSEADAIAASSEDFCGKWANDDQLSSKAFQYIFMTNGSCVRRDLPGDFVHLGIDIESEETDEFVRDFVACVETAAAATIAETSGERPSENPEIVEPLPEDRDVLTVTAEP